MFATRSRLCLTLSRQTSRNAPATTTNPFPFPKTSHPTPHQIFHLPPNASQSDIKARCGSHTFLSESLRRSNSIPDFDLVRIYHPDKAAVSVLPDVAHARFQSITNAYDALRNKTPLPASSSPYPESRYSATAATAHARSRGGELYSGFDDRWKDRLILAGLVAVSPTMMESSVTKAQNICHRPLWSWLPRHSRHDGRLSLKPWHAIVTQTQQNIKAWVSPPRLYVPTSLTKG